MDAESKKLKRLLIDIEFQEDRFQELKSAVEKLKDRKAKLKDEIKEAKAEIDQLYIDHNNKVLSYESQYEASEEIAKNHEDMIHRFEQRLFDAKDQAADEENKLNAILSKEDEYIKWEWLKKVKHLWSKFKQ